MGPFVYFLLAAAPLAAEGAPPYEAGSYLYRPAFCIDHELRGPTVPYVPQPGDLFLCSGRELWAKLGHRAALTAAPQHSGIVFARPDGSLALLEAGPHNSVRCHALDLVPDLASYAAYERVWIRRRRVPLTAEQSAALTAFALAVEGKPFAVLRMLAQVTPLRCRGPVSVRWLGGPHGVRHSYFCSELATEACVAAGLLDPATTRPAAMYPRDLFFGRSRNPYIDRHLDLSEWEPPARWTADPGAPPRAIRRFPWLDGDGHTSPVGPRGSG